MEDARTIFQAAKGDYSFRFDIFTPDDARMIRLKEVIATKLSDADRNVLILYAEVGSRVRTAQMLGVSKNTFVKTLKRIRETIKHEMDN
jgi:DNA-directed RNA polymerase specialized sigma subunit